MTEGEAREVVKLCQGAVQAARLRLAATTKDWQFKSSKVASALDHLLKMEASLERAQAALVELQPVRKEVPPPELEKTLDYAPADIHGRLGH